MRLAVVSSDGWMLTCTSAGEKLSIYDNLEFVEKREIEIAEDSKHQGGN